MTATVRLDIGTNLVLDGTGYGTIRLAPSGERWEIDRMHVRCSSRTNEARCIIYRGHIRRDLVVDATYSGSSGDTTDTRIYLEDGEAIHVEWTGGDSGATATVSLSGLRTAPTGGFRVR